MNTSMENQPPVSSVQELRARYVTQFPEHAQAQVERQVELEKDLGPTFQKFSTQLFLARARQREKQALAKPPGR